MDNDKKTACVLSALLALMAMVFLPSIYSGFFGDDFYQLSSIWHTLSCQPENLLRAFSGCWLGQWKEELYYRPLMSVSFLIDCLIWRLNSVGWHITNILLHIASTVLVLFNGRLLASYFLRRDDWILPFAGAALFALHPLHSSVVCVMAGRYDSVCTLLCLLSMLFFQLVNGRAIRHRFVSILALGSYACFALAMLCKEIAVVLPAVAALYVCFVQPDGTGLKARVAQAARSTAWLWVVLGSYIWIRTAVLGTICGVTGIIGSFLQRHAAERLMSPRIYQQMFAPVPWDMMNENSPVYQACIAVILCLLALVGLSRLLISLRSSALLRLSSFLVLWCVIAFLPTASVWSVGNGFAEGRHFYMMSAPLCILVALLVIPESSNPFNGLLRKAGIAAIALACFSMAFVCVKQNKYWIDAGKRCIQLRSAVNKALKEVTDEKLVLVNPPISENNISLYGRFFMLRSTFAEPFCIPELSSRIACLSPAYIDKNLINKSALLESLADKSRRVVWLNTKSGTLEPVASAAFQQLHESISVNLKLVQSDRVISTYSFCFPRQMSRFEMDCVEVTVECNTPGSGLLLSWNSPIGESDPFLGCLVNLERPSGGQYVFKNDNYDRVAFAMGTPMQADSKLHKIRFHLSEIMSWMMCGDPAQLRLSVCGDQGVRIHKVRILQLDEEVPVISASPELWTLKDDGSHTPKDRSRMTFRYDASRIKGARAVELEVGSPNRLCEFEDKSFRQTRLSECPLLVRRVDSINGDFVLDATRFDSNAVYQVRVVAVNEHGQHLGYTSDPVLVSF